jgi:hypothetical protein
VELNLNSEYMFNENYYLSVKQIVNMLYHCIIYKHTLEMIIVIQYLLNKNVCSPTQAILEAECFV